MNNDILVVLAVELFHSGDMTIGSAAQLAGLSRYEFEKILYSLEIPTIDVDITQVINDIKKLNNLKN